jgi:hypothetical protein
VKALLPLALVLACQNASKDQATAQAPAPGSAAASAAPRGPTTPAAAWYEGSWQGGYKAELHRIETSAGGVKEWKKDDGTQSSGEGKLSLEAKADGTVSGKASGALGEQSVSGRIEGESVALKLTPADANGFQGVILASQAPEGIKGTLSVSTGDSLVVRKADVTLSKAGK